MFKKYNVILLCCSIVFSLYAFELGAYVTKKLYYSEHSPAGLNRLRAALKQGIKFDTRTRLQFILDNEKAGNSLSPRIPPFEFNKSDGLKTQSGRLFPFGGLSNRRTVYCNNYGDYLLFNSDQWGLRNPPQAHQERPLDLVVVGDSFSMGHCVDDDIASLLRNSGLSSLSLAYSGNGPLIELGTIREYASQLSPKVVVWLYYEGNDLRGLKAESKSNILMRYLEPEFSQKLVDRQPEIDELLGAYVVKERAALIQRRSLSTVAKLTSTRVLLKKQFRPKKRQVNPDFALLKQALSQAQDDVQSWGGQMIFVYLPDWIRFAHPDNFAELNPLLQYRHDILNIAQGLGMTTVDIAEQMSLAQEPTSYYPYGLRGHYTEEGYAVVAEQILQALSENDLLQDSP